MYRRVALSLSAQIFALAVSVVERSLTVAVLVRAWGVEAFADWSVLISAAGLLAFGDLGMQIYYGNVLQRNDIRADHVAVARTFRTALTTYTVVCLALLAAVSAVAMLPLRDWLGTRTLTPPETAGIFICLAVANLALVHAAVLSMLYRVQGGFARGICVFSLVPLACAGVSVAAARLGITPDRAAFLYLSAVFGTGYLLPFLDLRRQLPGMSFRPLMPTRDEVADLVLHAKWYALHQGGPVLWNNAPILIMAAAGVGGGEMLAFLLARTVVSLARQLPTQLAISWGLELASCHHAGEELRRPLRDASIGIVSLSGALAGGLLVFTSGLIELWSGRIGGIDPLLVAALVAPIVITSPTLQFVYLQHFTNAARPLGIARLVQLALGFALCWVGAVLHGALGVAVGLAVAESVAFCVVLGILCRPTVADLFRHNTALAVTSSSLSFSVAWLLVKIVPFPGFSGLAAAGIAWGMFGVLPLVVLALPADLRRRTRAFLLQWITARPAP